MSQRTSGLYSLMQVPALYSAFQFALGGFRCRRLMARDHIRSEAGARVLDLGCGSGVMLPYMSDVQYVGIDANPEHIQAARRAYGDRGRFVAGDFASLEGELANSFDIVLCVGLLHHLDDMRTIEVARQARRYLAPQGRFVAFDPVFDDGQSWIARRLAAADSGQCVRSAQEYRSLVAQVLDNVEVQVRHDLLHVPYSHCVTTATCDEHSTA